MLLKDLKEQIANLEKSFLKQEILFGSDLTNKVSSDTLNKTLEYFLLLKKWNKTHDLVSPLGDDKLIFSHFIDSLSAFIVCKEAGLFNFFKSKLNYIDIGTGAGIPGIFWYLFFKDFFPELENTTYLVEPREKRITFLEEVRRTIITDIKPFKGNFSEFLKQKFTDLENSIFSVRALKIDKKDYNSQCNIIWLAGVNSPFDENIFSEKKRYYIGANGEDKRVILSTY